MLMQAFKSAADLEITEPQKAALMKTLVLLETGKLVHTAPASTVSNMKGDFSGHFNMGVWRHEQECGTVCCIAGTAEFVGNVEFGPIPDGLDELFFPPRSMMTSIVPSQAATALRSYLTTGNARWDLAVA